MQRSRDRNEQVVGVAHEERAQMMGASDQDLPAHGELRVLSTAVLDSTAVLILILQRNRSTEKQPEGFTLSCRVSGFGSVPLSLSHCPGSLSIIHIYHLHPSSIKDFPLCPPSPPRQSLSVAPGFFRTPSLYQN